jgi:acyl-homoserine-lactone acylase
MKKKIFTVFYTHHGPVIREQDGKWVSIELMQEHVKALEQSYLRTKATNFEQYRKTMELQANSSNNTVYADADGHIAYFHGNFIPRRDTHFDFTKPVDGSNPATDWHGLLSVAEIPQLFDPKSGYLFNVNDSPWNGSGESSLRQADFPAYVETGTESARGLHAMRLLKGQTNFTFEGLIAAAYDSYLPWFIKPVSAVVAAWNKLPADSEQKKALALEIAEFAKWNLRWDVHSVATTLAIYWGREIEKTGKGPVLPADQALDALSAASAKLTAQFGTWRVPWGDINRFQRISSSIEPHFNDARASLPVGFTASSWGSLAAFSAMPYPGTKKWYGTRGNSFVAVVEFGDRVHARAVTAGGESGHPASKHFNDQAERYTTGNLREVYFYPDQLKGHTERTYQPGK